MYVELLEANGYNVTVKHAADGNEMLVVSSESGTKHIYMPRLSGGYILGFYEAVEKQAKKFAAEVGIEV